MKHLFYLGVVALTAFMLVPNAALAQDEVSFRTGEQLVIDVDRSDDLFNKARQLDERARADQNMRDSERWIEVAELYVESAKYRPYGDAKAFLALDRAGDIFVHAEKTEAARRAYAAAGIRALEHGHVYEAGLAFANAAELSQQKRDGRGSLDYYRMAHRLSESPLLSDEQRQRIRMRLGLEGDGAQQ